ncbi:hypothetical protein MY3957_002686 [Beauveria namnaoensis]
MYVLLDKGDRDPEVGGGGAPGDKGEARRLTFSSPARNCVRMKKCRARMI